MLVEPRFHLGVGARADDPPALEATDRAGFLFGAGLRVQPASRFSVGLLYEHFDLGRERSGVGDLGSIGVERDLNTLWATLAIAIARLGPVSLDLEIGPGLSWQSAGASGFVLAGSLGTEPIPFACEGSASADLALRGAVGASGSLGRVAYLWSQGFVGLHSLSSDALDGCAPGAGSATVLGLAAGAGFRADVTSWTR